MLSTYEAKFLSSGVVFFSCTRRKEILRSIGISQVPQVAIGHFTLPALQKLLAQSHFSDNPSEGLYLRVNQGDWLIQRAKLVRPAFIQSVEQHWSRSGIKPNRLDLEY